LPRPQFIEPGKPIQSAYIESFRLKEKRRAGLLSQGAAINTAAPATDSAQTPAREHFSTE
jgi:hypothetical protein